MNPVSVLRQFLLSRQLQNKKVLLALSGGPDSMALFHSLLQCHRGVLAIAHVDHGWRQESPAEAEHLLNLAQRHNLAFHKETLNPKAMQGNLEEACRHARYAFFVRLCHEHGYEGVFLGHHADDQAETILKRVLEGANPIAIQGMKTDLDRQGVMFYRPFLSITKKDILLWLENHHHSWFEDATNKDPAYLRSKMRLQILPQLAEQFGKEVTKPLCHLGDQMAGLNSFIDEQYKYYLPLISRGWAGWMADLEHFAGLHPFIAKQLIYKILHTEEVLVSHGQLDNMTRDIQSQTANKRYATGKKIIDIDRGHLFVHTQQPNLEKSIPLKLGTTQWGVWAIHVTENQGSSSRAGWKEIWKGRSEICVPANQQYSLGMADVHARYLLQSKELGRWWTEKKVPAFLRDWVPIIIKDGAVVGEFLGEQRYQGKEGEWRVTLCYSK